MKNRFKFLAMLVALAVSGAVLHSCDDDDDNDYWANMPNALVTVKQIGDTDGFYMQLDEETTLFPVNMDKSPFDNKEVRALVNFKYVATIETESSYGKAVHVNWIDSILTKKMVVCADGEDCGDVYGNDPVEIVRDWVTVAEDGYLTLRFRTRWGNYRPHKVNLVGGINPDNPYEVMFCHDADGDGNGYVADGLVAFRLDRLPDTGGQTVDLTLRWMSFSGEKSVKFKYNSSGRAEGGDGQVSAEMLKGSFVSNVK